jgi:hypothetical protein
MEGSTGVRNSLDNPEPVYCVRMTAIEETETTIEQSSEGARAVALQFSICDRIACLAHPHNAVARRCHICTATGLAPITSAPRPGSRLPHLHHDCLPHLRRDWACPCHICTGTPWAHLFGACKVDDVKARNLSHQPMRPLPAAPPSAAGTAVADVPK